MCEHLDRFLCDGANQPHPLHESIEWICNHSHPPSDMECSYNSDYDNTTTSDDDGEEERNASRDFMLADEEFPYQGYQHSEEELTENDIINFNSICKDVEMVESIEKLGRSLGDPQLSTTLKQRANMTIDLNKSSRLYPPTDLHHRVEKDCTYYMKPSSTDLCLPARLSGLIPPEGHSIGEALRKEAKVTNASLENAHHLSISPYEKKDKTIKLNDFQLIKLVGAGSNGTHER